MSILDRIIEYSPQERISKQNGGRTGFVDGLSALSFGKEQSIFSPQNFQRLFSATGQRDYPKAYKVITDALEKAGITYTPKSKGAGFDFGNVTKETVDIFNKEATKLKAERNLPMSRYQSAKIKKDIKTFVKDKIKKGEYVSRPIIKEYFGLTKGRSGDMLITRSLGINEKPGTGLLKNLGQEEKKAATKINFSKATDAKMETKNAVLKIINDEFKLDPDLSNSEDLAKIIYGDQFPEGDIKNMSSKDLKKAEAMVRQTDNDVMTYLKVIQGARKKPDGMRLPTQNVINDIVDNILTGIDDEVADGKSQFKKKSFRFSSGLLRDYKMAIVNKNLGLDPDTFRSERAKLVLKNKNLDEIFSISALADIAPGYTTKVQSIKKVINRKKANEIDLPFQRIINALNEGKTSMKVNKKTVPIENVIKDFNKTSAEFSKKNKVQSPKINYNEKFDKTILDSYGKASQENIKQVYKDKKFFLSEINPKIKTQDILGKQILQNITSYSKLDKCKIGRAEGGRIGFALSDECIRDGLIEQKKLAASGNKKAAKELVDVAKVASRGGLLKNVLGPGALLGEAVFEGAIIGNKVLGGKPLDQAWAESYLSYLDPRKYRGELDPMLMERDRMLTRTLEDEEGNVIRKMDAPYSNLLKAGFSAQDQLSFANKAAAEAKRAKAAGRMDQYFPAAADAREQGARANLSASIISNDAFKEASEQAKEYLRAQEGKRRFDLGIFGTPQGSLAEDRRMYQANKAMQNLYYQYSDEDLIKMLQNAGYNPQDIINLKTTERLTPSFARTLGGLDSLRSQFQEEEAMQRIADAGGVANLAGGGIAEIRRPSSIPPQSGPTPQGLLSVKNNVKRY